ncbi:MAG: GldG family protein [Eubacteriales bacterium]|nr:GldG family protein [Eubacteriales bacterium]
MTLLFFVLYLAAIAAALLAVLLLYRSKTARSGGFLLLLSGAFSVLFSVLTFFTCFFCDAGILPVPIVLVVSFGLLRLLFGRANAAEKTDRRRAPRAIAVGSRTKRTKRFLLSSGSVALAVAVIVLLNLICTNLNDRFDLNLDLTASKMYSISQESYEVMDGLTDEVTITVLLSKDDLESSSYGSYIQTLMEKYAEYSDKITLDYIDPYQNPSAVDSFSALSSSVAEGSIIVQCGDQSRVLNLIDFYDTDADSTSGYSYVSAFRGESTLTSALLTVTSADTPHAYVLQGHNESISTSFSDLLESSGYSVDTLTLAEEDIPDDASLLILSLPQKDYTEDEVNLLDDYVKNGGDLLVFDGTESPTDLDVLYSYLKEWGITVEPQMVLDSEYNINDARYLLAELGDSSVNDSLEAISDQVIVTPDAKPLTVELADSVSDRTVESLLSSRETAYARAIDEDTTYDSYSKQDGDTDGPFALAALAEYTGNEENGQILVCSSALMMTDQLMQSSSLLNSDFLSNTISSMQPTVDLISIDSKSMSAEPLTLSTTATYVVFLILLFLPLFLFGYGIAVFFHRRNL